MRRLMLTWTMKVRHTLRAPPAWAPLPPAPAGCMPDMGSPKSDSPVNDCDLGMSAVSALLCVLLRGSSPTLGTWPYPKLPPALSRVLSLSLKPPPLAALAAL